MHILFYILMVAVLVAYSQIVVKWRVSSPHFTESNVTSLIDKAWLYLSDPYILSGYVVALLSSFLWLFVISKIPLSIGFPIYIGITFLLVIFGSWLFIGEQLTALKLISALTIFVGIVIGASE